MSSRISHILSIPAFADNLIWLIPTAPQQVAAVDPGEAAPLLLYLAQHELGLSHILLTHHHADHTAGVAELKARHPARIIGNPRDDHRLPPIDCPVEEGLDIPLGEKRVRVMAVPGHTTGHLAYLVDDLLFPGDTLFRFGCGRLFEGTAAEMWHSLERFNDLPAPTRLFPAHDYALPNLRFALSLEPHHPALLTAWDELNRLREKGESNLPITLAEERELNPFLRCRDPRFLQGIGLGTLAPQQAFALLRERRNRF